MKITICEDPNVNEIEISITCSKMTDNLKEIVSSIGLIGLTFAGERDGETFLYR